MPTAQNYLDLIRKLKKRIAALEEEASQTLINRK